MAAIEILESNYRRDISHEKPNKYPPTLYLVQLGFATIGRIAPSIASKLAYKLFATPRIRAKHKSSDTILASAKVFEFLHSKDMLKGYEWNSSGEKTILLVHGWESRGTALRSFVPSLIEQGYRVVAFDGPGHGDSAGTSTNMAHFAGAIQTLIHHIGGVHGIISHSFGGGASVFLLSQLEPSMHLSRLVLIAVPSNIKQILKNFFNIIHAPSSVRRKLYEHVGKQAKIPIDDLKISTLGQNIQVDKALIIHDKSDKVVPFSEAHAIAEAWKNATLLITHGYGHYLLVRNPDVVKRVVSFMKD